MWPELLSGYPFGLDGHVFIVRVAAAEIAGEDVRASTALQSRRYGGEDILTKSQESGIWQSR